MRNTCPNLYSSIFFERIFMDTADTCEHVAASHMQAHRVAVCDPWVNGTSHRCTGVVALALLLAPRTINFVCVTCTFFLSPGLDSLHEGFATTKYIRVLYLANNPIHDLSDVSGFNRVRLDDAACATVEGCRCATLPGRTKKRQSKRKRV